MKAEVKELLRQVSIFAQLNEGDLSALARKVRRRRFGPGVALFHEGDAGNAMYLIVSGAVSIQRESPDEEVFFIAQRGRGEPFGELALIDGKPRMADAITAEPCELLILEQADFHACIAQYPSLALSVMACLADRLREAADYQEWWRSLDVLGRLAAWLLDLKSRHGITPQEFGAELNCQVNQQEIAGRIRATRESVNRAFGRLKKIGAVRVDGGRVVILDEVKLRGIIN